jgi:erythronate-4-phosphate dehydrogenase
MLNIIADQNMPLVETLFAPFGRVNLLPGRSITAADVREADVLLVRSVTSVDRQLLEGSAVRFVGSATIGTDHIDKAYLVEAGIEFAHAPGCNAEAVVQYDLAVMSHLAPEWRQKTVGIVGCGNVGSRLYRRRVDLGVSCAVYDPFLSVDDIADLGDLAAVTACDIICLHTPLTTDGDYPSYHLFNKNILMALNPDVLLINAGRGAVIDNQALLHAFRQGFEGQVALDVWESEPEVDRDLMAFVALATPHVAGYSLEGKINGTTMIHKAFHHWIGLGEPENRHHNKETLSPIDVDSLNQAILRSYNIALDDKRMRVAINDSDTPVSQSFDQLRKDYQVRHEFAHYAVEPDNAYAADCEKLGFTVLY